MRFETIWSARRGARSADRVRAHLRKRLLQLKRFPLIGTMTSDETVRILPPIRYPYRIYYAVTDEAVVILHIRHTSRAEPDELPRPQSR